MDANTLTAITLGITCLGTAFTAWLNYRMKMMEQKQDDVKTDMVVLKTQTDGMQTDLKKAIEGDAFGKGVIAGIDRQELKAAEVVKEAAATVATAADAAASVLKIAAGSAGARIPVETVADLEAKKAKAAEGKA